MNKRTLGVLIACSVLCLLAGCSRLPKTNLKIQLPDGQKTARIYVMDYQLDKEVEAVKNTVTFAVPSNKAVIGTVSFGKEQGGRSCQFIPDGTTLTIDLTSARPVVKSDDPNSLNLRMVELNREEMQMASDYARKIQQIREDASMDDEARELMARATSSEMQRAVTGIYLKRASEEKDNYLGANAVVMLRERIPHETLDSLISTMSPQVVKSARVRELRNNLHALMKTAEGQPFQDFTVENQDGKVRFSDYVGKGKYILVDFWASWNNACLADFSALKDVYYENDGDKFTVLGVAVWDDEEKTRAVVEKYRIPWDCIHGGSTGTTTYGLREIPERILFGPDGTILKRGIRMDDLPKVVAFYLGK